MTTHPNAVDRDLVDDVYAVLLGTADDAADEFAARGVDDDAVEEHLKDLYDLADQCSLCATWTDIAELDAGSCADHDDDEQ